MKNHFEAVILSLFVECLVFSLAVGHFRENPKSHFRSRDIDKIENTLACQICGLNKNTPKNDADLKSFQDSDYDLNHLDKRHYSSLLKNKEYLPLQKRFFNTVLRNEEYDDDNLREQNRHESSLFKNAHYFGKDAKRHIGSVFASSNNLDRSRNIETPSLIYDQRDKKGTDDNLESLRSQQKLPSEDEISSYFENENSLIFPYFEEFSGNTIPIYSSPYDKRHYSSLLKDGNYMKRHISSVFKERMDQKRNENERRHQPLERDIGGYVSISTDETMPENLPPLKMGFIQDRIMKRHANYPIINNLEADGKATVNKLNGNQTTQISNGKGSKHISDETHPVNDIKLTRKKRHIAALARNGNFPFRPSRVIKSYSSVPLDSRSTNFAENALNNYNSGESSAFSFQDRYVRPDIYPPAPIGYFPPPQKRFLGSLARKTWFPRQYRSFLNPDGFSTGNSVQETSGGFPAYDEEGGDSRHENYERNYFIPNGYIG